MSASDMFLLQPNGTNRQAVGTRQALQNGCDIDTTSYNSQIDVTTDGIADIPGVWGRRLYMMEQHINKFVEKVSLCQQTYSTDTTAKILMRMSDLEVSHNQRRNNLFANFFL